MIKYLIIAALGFTWPDAPPDPPQQFIIQVDIVDGNNSVLDELLYGSPDTGPVVFDSLIACQTAERTDQKLIDGLARFLKVVQQHVPQATLRSYCTNAVDVLTIPK